MYPVTATIGATPYLTEITSESGVAFIADEPVSMGGGNTGPSPSELLNAALAACTDITLRMYAERKKWNLTSVKTTVSYERDSKANTTTMKREIILSGDLTAEQRQRLLDIANRCPIHEVLKNPVTIETTAE